MLALREDALLWRNNKDLGDNVEGQQDERFCPGEIDQGGYKYYEVEDERA